MTLTVPRTYAQLISLGYNCQTKFTVHKLMETGPELVLDGLVSYKLERVIELLRTGFSSFFLLENLVCEGRTAGSQCYLTIKDGLNEITSIHDFQAGIPFDEAYSSYMERKYPQYTKLLEDVKTCPAPLLFVRRNKGYEKMETTIRLVDTLKELRGEKPFDVFVFQGKDWAGKDWGIPHLHTFCDGEWKFDPREGWVGNESLWTLAFRGVRVNPDWLLPNAYTGEPSDLCDPRQERTETKQESPSDRSNDG